MTLTAAIPRPLPRQRSAAAAGLPLLAVICGGGAVVVTALVEQSLLASMTIALALAGIGAALLSIEGGPHGERLRLQRLFWITFGFRLLIMALLHHVLKEVYGAGRPYWQYGENPGDEGLFYESTGRYAAAWHQGAILDVKPYWYESTILAWLHIIGFIRFIGQQLAGDVVFNIKLFTCLCSALIVPYTYKIARRLFDERIALLAAWLSFWLPDYWYMASTILRDILICFLILYIISQMIEICLVRFQVWRLVLVVLINFGVIPYLRGQLSIIIIALVGMLICISQWRRVRSMIAPVMLSIILLIAVRPAPAPDIGSFVTSESLQQRSSSYVTKSLDEADTASLGKQVQRLPLVLRGPISAVQLLLLPIPPWGPVLGKGFTPRGVVEAVAGLVWFFALAPLIPTGLVETLRRNFTKAVWVWGPVVVLALLLGLAGGVLLRWRLMFMPCLMILIAQGYVARDGYPGVRLLTRLGMLALLAVYLTLKYIV